MGVAKYVWAWLRGMVEPMKGRGYMEVSAHWRERPEGGVASLKGVANRSWPVEWAWLKLWAWLQVGVALIGGGNRKGAWR